MTLIESGSDYLADEQDSLEDRSYAWALFEQKATGKRFIATTAHYTADTSAWKARREQATSYVEAKYGVPVMACGDFNSSPTDYENKSIMEKSFYSARNKCEVRENMKFSTVNQDGALGGKAVTGSAIDHVFYSMSGLKAKHFETIISYYGYIVSDHLPIFFDFIVE